MTTRTLATLLLAGLATVGAATLATAAPAERYDCHAVQDGTFEPERSCAEGNMRRKYGRPTFRQQQKRDWRERIFDQALSSGAGGGGGGGGSR